MTMRRLPKNFVTVESWGLYVGLNSVICFMPLAVHDVHGSVSHHGAQGRRVTNTGYSCLGIARVLGKHRLVDRVGRVAHQNVNGPDR